MGQDFYALKKPCGFTRVLLKSGTSSFSPALRRGVGEKLVATNRIYPILLIW
jgi:hypothetical protein